MLIGGIVGWEEGRDDLFDRHSLRNRDDCLEPFRVLREEAQKLDIQLHTLDVLLERGVRPNFNLYLESLPIIPIEGCKNYLIRFETELTVPINGDPDYLNQFDGIFTWDQDLLGSDNGNLLRQQIRATPLYPICYPNVPPLLYRFNEIVNPGFSGRDIGCALIGSNRHANILDARELYSERVKAIRWFEKNTTNFFSLFGNGWLVPQKRLGAIGKIKYRLEKIPTYLFGKKAFPSYRGPAKTKFDIFIRARFSICFENAKNIHGYITEKIFDCLFAGCVPIYWGEPTIEGIIPRACFIDFREFAQKPDPYGELYDCINNMSETTYLKYQEAGRDFLSSTGFDPFTSKAFSDSILRRIQS